MKEQQTPPTAEDILGRYERPLTFEKVWAMFQETDKKFQNTLYGAMACLKQDANAADMAMNKGLLVIHATGDSASIINKPGYEAKTW